MKWYFKNHPSYKYEENLKYRKWISEKYKFDLKNYINQIKSWNILEIWTWIWNFAYFCDEIWTKKYTWIDIDDYFFNFHRKEFKKYNFVKDSFQNFLNTNKDYDMVFTSHLFEHLNKKERIEIINYIYKWLKKWWIWINYMPNADSSLIVWFWRWWDVTHTTIYNKVSFQQLINQSWNDFSNIKHLNINIWQNFIKRMIHKIFLFFSKIYYIWMWRNFPEIYTWEIISILKK